MSNERQEEISRDLDRRLEQCSLAAYQQYEHDITAWNGGSADVAALDRIFGSGAGYPQISGRREVDALLTLGRSGLAPARIHQLVQPLPGTVAYLQEILRHDPYRDADSAQARMKLLALHWLHSRGGKDLSVEGDYEGGRYDAACEDLGVIVECGTTRIDKLFSVAVNSSWREFVVVPRVTDIAVIFDFRAVQWNSIRASARSVCDRVTFLTEVLQTRLTPRAIVRCAQRTQEAFAAKLDRWRTASNP